jgi:hypothetical protein
MKKTKHNEEKVIGGREAARSRAVKESAREMGVTDQTPYN